MTDFPSMMIFAFLWSHLISADSAMFSTPAFVGGIPGRMQMQSIEAHNHQARTLLYLQAIEELRRNPQAADVPDCSAANANKPTACLPKAVATTVPQHIANLPIKKRFALLIGNRQYLSPIPELDTPIQDVNAIAEILRGTLGFTDVHVIENATKNEIITAMADLAHNVGSGDSVLVLYAGHGYLMDDTNMGYWIPTDGSTKTAAQWISNKDISKLLHAIPARQIILISDSCFSGSLTKEEPVADVQVDPEQILRKRSVIAFSSGGEEPVSDEGKEGHSIFAWYFMQSLQHLDALTLGENVYQTVRNQVSKDYPQTPQYGAMVSAGHENGGEYLFYPK